MSFQSAFFNGIHAAANETLGDIRYFVHNPSFESFLPILYSNSSSYKLFGSDPSTSISPDLTRYLDFLQARASEGAEGLPGSGSVLTPGSPGSPGSPGFYPSPSAQQIDYLYADLAKHYGMSKETAYEEAMANTAYQRAVADMQMAGLNPASLYSAGRASTAPVVHGSSFSGGYSSAKGASKKDQLPGWLYYGVQAAAYALGGPKASLVSGMAMKAINGLK